MFPKYKWPLNNNIIKVNKIKHNNIKIQSNYTILKSKSTNNYLFNMTNNIEINLNKNQQNKNNINNQIKKLNILNPLNNSLLTIQSKSFVNNFNMPNSERKINRITYYRNNKYLIPMIEKNKTKKNILKNKTKEAQFCISDFFSNVRQKTERFKAESEKDNNYYNIDSIRANYSLDNIKNIFFEKNSNKLTKNVNNNNISNLPKVKYSPFLTENNIKSKNESKFSNYKFKYIKSLFNNETTPAKLNNNEKKDEIKENYYLRNNQIINNKINKINFKNDFDNYLQNKKLFFIYRGKLFKLLYQTLYKIFHRIKCYVFDIIKKYYIYRENNIQKILHRISKKIKNRNNKDNLNLNNSMNTSKSCIYFIRDKNEKEIKKRKEKSELCRNKNYLKEKYEEIRKRKHLKKNNDNIYNTEKIININSKNKKLFDNNTHILKGIYKKKKLHNINKNISNKSNKKISNNEISNNFMTKDKLNKFMIKKKIKILKSEDNRLFITINYAYLSNTEIEGKKTKYNNNILKIYNSDKFSIIKKMKIKKIKNKDKIIGIIEEESSNINYTNDSNNSTDNKIENKTKNINKNTINKNDKYLFSCVNFILKTIKRIILKNYFEYYEKKLKSLL